jgi:predicted nucleic acid-binding protein
VTNEHAIGVRGAQLSKTTKAGAAISVDGWTEIKAGPAPPEIAILASSFDLDVGLRLSRLLLRMRSAFLSYYRPTQKEFEKLWQECWFAFDANFLLDFYRYANETRDKILDLLEKLTNRIWLPHQAALEFHRNRLQVIGDVWKPYNEAKNIAVGAKEDALTKLASIPRKHPFIRVEQIRRILENSAKKLERALDEAAKKHPNLLDDLESDHV